MSAPDTLIEEDRYAARAGVPLRRALAMLGCFYVLATLLNATGLERKVERLPFGPTRAKWMRVVTPLANVVRACGLDRPRKWIEQFNPEDQ